MDDRDKGLPPSLALVWGLRERPRRGPKPGLTLDQIVAAAMELADAEGLAAVSMSRVAEKLGFTTMSLYRYVSGKDELLMLMVEAAAAAPIPEPGPVTDWRTGMQQFARYQRDLFGRHPWVTQIPLSGPPITPNQIGMMEYALGCLADSGLDEGERVQVLSLVSLYVRNQARLEYDIAQAYAAALAAARASGGDELQIGPSAYGQSGPATYGEVLRRLVDPAKYPALTAVIESGAFDDSHTVSDDDFEFGLQRILDGVAAHVATKPPTTTAATTT
jgi:AcrR family transcriptional regulator